MVTVMSEVQVYQTCTAQRDNDEFSKAKYGQVYGVLCGKTIPGIMQHNSLLSPERDRTTDQKKTAITEVQPGEPICFIRVIYRDLDGGIQERK